MAKACKRVHLPSEVAPDGNGGSDGNRGSSRILPAARDGNAETVSKMLSTAGAQSWIDYQSDLGYTPLYIAALLNHASITEQLIVARCNIDLHREDGATPLIIAGANGWL